MEDTATERLTLFVCNTCRRVGEAKGPQEQRSGVRMANAVAGALDRSPAKADIDLVEVACLSNCKRACTVAFASPSKWTIVTGDLDPAQAGDVVAFAEQHLLSRDGLPTWAERPQSIRAGTIARVPPSAAADRKDLKIS